MNIRRCELSPSRKVEKVIGLLLEEWDGLKENEYRQNDHLACFGRDG